MLEILYRVMQSKSNWKHRNSSDGYWIRGIGEVVDTIVGHKFDGKGDRYMSTELAYVQGKPSDPPIKGVVRLFRPATGFNSFEYNEQQKGWGWHRDVAWNETTGVMLHTKLQNRVPLISKMNCSMKKENAQQEIARIMSYSRLHIFTPLGETSVWK